LNEWTLTVSGEPGEYVVEVVCLRADPQVAGWRSEQTLEIADWVQPPADDGYGLHEIVRHNNDFWRSTDRNNVSEPGVSGWQLYAENTN
jgi:hypothetical protein